MTFGFWASLSWKVITLTNRETKSNNQVGGTIVSSDFRVWCWDRGKLACEWHQPDTKASLRQLKPWVPIGSLRKRGEGTAGAWRHNLRISLARRWKKGEDPAGGEETDQRRRRRTGEGRAAGRKRREVGGVGQKGEKRCKAQSLFSKHSLKLQLFLLR